MLLSYNSPSCPQCGTLVSLLVAGTCTQAFWWTCARGVRVSVCVPTFVFLYESVCVLPACMGHYRSPAERSCLSASLGLSPRSSKRMYPAGNGSGPEYRENGESVETEEEKQDSVLRRKKFKGIRKCEMWVIEREKLYKLIET